MPVYIDIGPEGQLTDTTVTLPDDAIVDLCDRKCAAWYSDTFLPFTGLLIDNDETEYRLAYASLPGAPSASLTSLRFAESVKNEVVRLDGRTLNFCGAYPATGLIFWSGETVEGSTGGNAGWKTVAGLWTGAAGDGNWSNPANWSDGVVPSAGTSVVIPVTARESPLSITIPEDALVGSLTVTGRSEDAELTLSGGSLAVAGDLSVVDDLTLSLPEGAISVGGDAVVDGATVSIGGDGSLAISGTTEVGNGGRIDVATEGSFASTSIVKPTDGSMSATGAVNVAEGGLFDVEGVDLSSPDYTVEVPSYTFIPTQSELLVGKMEFPNGLPGVDLDKINVDGIKDFQVTTGADGAVTITWKPLATSLNLNFGADVMAVAADTTQHGVFAVAGTEWTNLYNHSGTQDITNGTEALIATPNVVYASVNNEIGNQTDTTTILRGSLVRPTITVENIPYEMYDVIIYASTNYTTAQFPPVKVNGTYYTWQEKVPTFTTAPTHAAGPFYGQGGQAAAQLGVNAIRVQALTDKTLSIVSTRPDDRRVFRNSIAAVQIVQRVVLPVNGQVAWSDLTAGLDGLPLYLDFGPNGQITGDVTLSDDDIVDVEQVPFSANNAFPFAGKLTNNLSTEYRVSPTSTNLLRISASLQGATDPYAPLCLATIGGVYGDIGFAYVTANFACVTTNTRKLPVVWTGTAGDGDWNNPQNWSTGKVPTADSPVYILVEDGEEVDINIPNGANAANLTVIGRGDCGKISLNGALSVTGTMTVEGSLTVGGTAFAPGFTADGTVTVDATLRPIPTISGGEDTILTIIPSESELVAGSITFTNPEGFDKVTIAGVDSPTVNKGDTTTTITWTKLRSALNLNFGSEVAAIPVDDGKHYGVFPAPGTEWFNLTGANSEAQEMAIGLTANPTVEYTSRGVGVRPTNIDPILSGSLDTADITVRNVPYEKYDVIVYYATSYKNGVFPPVKVNGTYYTWDEALKTGYPTTVNGPSFGQGGISYVGLGVNAQRIYGLTDATLNVVSHKSFNKDGKHHRGCIAGIQIVRRVVLTVDSEANWGDLTAGIDTNTPIEVTVLPGGSITGNVDLTGREDVIIDLTGFDFSTGDQPFDGTLTVEDSTTILLPTNQEQYRPDGETVKGQIADSITGNPILGLGDDRFQSNDDVTLADGAVTIQTPSVTLPTIWTGAGDGTNWNDPDNWSTGVVPGADTNVVIPVKDGATPSITIPDGAAAGSVTVVGQGDSGNLTLNGGKLDVTGDLAIEGNVDVSQTGAVTAGGTLTIDSGTLTVEVGASLGVTGETTLVNDGQLIIKGEGDLAGGTAGDTVVDATDGSTVTGPTDEGAGTVNVSGAGNVTIGGNVDLGESRPTVTIPEGGDATITVTPTPEEAEQGVITIPGDFTETNKPTVNVEGVTDAEVSVDENGDLSVTWAPSDYSTFDEIGAWTEGDKWSTGSVPESGVVVVDGETYGPITVTLPEGDIAEGITQVIVKGDVTFIGEALPPEVALAPGASVTVGGTTLPEGWELPAGTTLVVTEPNDSLAGATLDGKVVIDLSENTTDKVIDLGGADFNGGLEIAGDTSTVILGTVDDQVEVSEGAHTIEGAEGIAPDFTEGGAITVADDAEVVLGPNTNWDGVTLPVTGGGTLDIDDSRPTLDGNGPKGELPSHIVVTPTQEETEAGAVTIPVTEGTSLPGDFTVTVGDKTYGKDAVTVEDGNLVVDLDKPLAPSIDGASIVDALPDDLVDDLNAAASEGGLTGNYEVKVETAGQEVADLDAEQLGSILDAFEGLVPEVDQEANTLTYTYAFGIAAMAVSEDGTWRVTVQVASGERAVAFAAGSAYTLTVTPRQGEQRTLTFADEGVEATGTPDTVILVTTELPQEGDFALKIAITPPARK